jgi:hypothetical protein
MINVRANTADELSVLLEGVGENQYIIVGENEYLEY